MKKVRTLLVVFENSIQPHLVPAFRGAIIARVDRSNKAFHNHDKEGFIYKYPLIQYKIISGKASLFCIGSGVDEIHHFFGLKNWEVQLHDQRLDLKIDRLDLSTFTFNVWKKKFTYNIRNWLALNSENYKKYQQLEGIVSKTIFLERLLTGNILSFAKGIDWHIDKPVKVQINEIKGQKTVQYKGVPLLAFDVDFSCNVSIPNHSGLGKSASHGYGVMYQYKKENSEIM